MNDNNFPEKRSYKLTDSSYFLPYSLYGNILIETDIKTAIVDEQYSELWYETLHGQGIAKFKNFIYKGNINFGILDSRIYSLHGTHYTESESEITFNDGTFYKGTIHNNIIDGKGMFTFPTGAIYEGEVKNGLRDGYGTYTCERKKISYEGEWKEGLKHGKGKLIKPTMIYDGEWNKGVINGNGKIRWVESNNYYCGDIKKALLDGNGFLIWNGVNEKYCGQWKDNLQNGIGMHTWFEPKGELKLLRNRYVGYWKNGKRNGYGVFYYANGGKYEGYWENDKKNGFGVIENLDRSLLAGIFENDRLVEEIKVSDIESSWVVVGMNIMLNDKTKCNNESKPSNGERGSISKKESGYDKMKTILKRKSIFKNVMGGSLINTDTNNTNTAKENDVKNNSNVSSTVKRNSIIKSNSLQQLNTNHKPTNGLSESPQKVLSPLELKRLQIVRNLDSKKIYVDFSDLKLYDIKFTSMLKELDNILLRNLTDITHWYQMIANHSDYKDNDLYSSIATTNDNIITKTISSLAPMVNNIINTLYHNDKFEKNELIAIQENIIVNNDYSFCMELKDLWKFLRDLTCLSNYDFTIAEIDRYFFNSDRNYYEMFYIPDNMITAFIEGNANASKDIYEYIYNKVSKEQFNFDCKYFKASKGFIQTINNPTNTNNIHLGKNIHNKNQVILLKHFYEVLIRIAYFKPLNDNKQFIPLEDKLKDMFTYLKPIMRTKRKSLNFSKGDASSVSSHSMMGDSKKQSIESLLETFITQYETKYTSIFNTIYSLSTSTPSFTDRTITYDYLYTHYLMRIDNEDFKRPICKKSLYCEFILSITSKQVHASTASNVANTNMNNSKRSGIFQANKDENLKRVNKLFAMKNEPTWKRYMKVLNSEMICFEFCELMFHLSRRYFITTKIKEENNYNDIVNFMEEAIVKEKEKMKIRKDKIVGRNEYVFPKLKVHVKIEEIEKRNLEKELEMQRKEKERKRYIRERNCLQNEDINMYKEESEEEQSEEEEESEY